MRIALLAALLAQALPTAAQDWTPIDLGTSEDIRFVQATSFSWAWIAGTGGLVVKSDYTREIWDPVDTGSGADMYSVLEPSAGQVWTGGGGGEVRRLIGGIWEARNLPVTSEDFSFFTGGSGTAAAIGSGGSIYFTDDGGSTWELKHDAGVALHDGTGYISGTVHIVGAQGTYLRGTDGGSTWTAGDTGTDAELWAFHSAGAVGLLACGSGGTLIHSGDNGATWESIETGTSQTLYDIDSSGQNAGWLLMSGAGGTVLRSSDGGQTWCHLDAGTSVDLHGCDMVLNSEYIVGGDGGLLLRTTTGGGDCIPVAAADPPPARETSLDVFPNPLRRTGSARFASPRAGAYTLELLDVNGRRLRRLAEGRLAAGAPQGAPLDLRDLAAGVYLLRLETRGETVSRRITLLR